MIYIVIQTSQRQTFYSVCNVHTVKCWMQTQIPIPRAIDRYGQSTADRRPRSNEDDAKQVGGSRNGRSGGRRHRKDAPKRNYTASVACFLQSRIDTSPAEIDTCTSFSFCSELLVYPRERAHTHTHTHDVKCRSTRWHVYRDCGYWSGFCCGGTNRGPGDGSPLAGSRGRAAARVWEQS